VRSLLLAAPAALWIALGVLATATARRWLVALAAFPLLLCAAYYAGRAPRIHPWYLLPPLWCASVLLAIGVAELPRRLPSLRRVPLAYALAVVVLLGVPLAEASRRELVYRTLEQSYEDGLRRRLGEWLHSNTPPDATVATEAIGYQGYFSKRRIVDLGGLVSPQVVAIAREADGPAAAFHAVVTRIRPDFVVLRSVEVDRNVAFHGGPLFATLAQRDDFATRYEEVARFSAPDTRLFGALGHLTVYARRESRAGTPGG
jgi:hypothetical protein